MASWTKSLTKGASNVAKSGGGSLFKSAAGSAAKSFLKNPSTYTNLLGSAAGALSKSGGSNSDSGGWMDALGGLFGGGGDDSGSGNIWGALLSGLGGAADSYLNNQASEKSVAEAGKQQRKTAAFAADIADYQQQKEKARKRIALDTYGQFSLIKRYAPNYVEAPPVEVPTKPIAS